MPFCIIFLSIAILYAIILEKNIFNKIFFCLLCVIAILGLFTGDIEVLDNLEINILFTIFIVALLVYAIIKSKSRLFFLSLLFSIAIGFVYNYLIKLNIFNSVDYDIYISIAICLVPSIIFSFDLFTGVITSILNVTAIVVVDAIFWMKELNYVAINTINIANLLLILILVNIGFNRLFSLIKSRKENMNEEVV